MIDLIKRMLFSGGVSQFQLGDEVEFNCTVDIIMDNGYAWIDTPGARVCVEGIFKRPGEKFVMRGKVSALSRYVHVTFPKDMNNPSSNTASFCSDYWHFWKVKK